MTNPINANSPLPPPGSGFIPFAGMSAPPGVSGQVLVGSSVSGGGGAAPAAGNGQSAEVQALISRLYTTLLAVISALTAQNQLQNPSAPVGGNGSAPGGVTGGGSGGGVSPTGGGAADSARGGANLYPISTTLGGNTSRGFELVMPQASVPAPANPAPAPASPAPATPQPGMQPQAPVTGGGAVPPPPPGSAPVSAPAPAPAQAQAPTVSPSMGVSTGILGTIGGNSSRGFSFTQR